MSEIFSSFRTNLALNNLHFERCFVFSSLLQSVFFCCIMGEVSFVKSHSIFHLTRSTFEQYYVVFYFHFTYKETKMAEITTKNIRNVVLLGHGGSGKTSIAEAALYLTKGTDRLGKTTAGNTVCDYDPEEIKRGFSLTLSLAPVMWETSKINFIDTPGCACSRLRCYRPRRKSRR